MGHVITGVHFFSALKVHHRAHRILPLEQYFAQEDIGSGRVWLEQQGTLQGLLCLRVIACTSVSISQPVIDAAIGRVAEPFLLKLRNGLVNMFASERDFAEEGMRKRQLWIKREGLRGKLLSYREVFSTQQHSRSQKKCRRRVRGKVILGGESPTCVVIVARVEVAES